MFRYPWEAMVVVVGAHNKHDHDDTSTVIYEVETLVAHEYYNENGTIVNDIMLIKTKVGGKYIIICNSFNKYCLFLFCFYFKKQGK